MRSIKEQLTMVLKSHLKSSLLTVPKKIHNTQKPSKNKVIAIELPKRNNPTTMKIKTDSFRSTNTKATPIAKMNKNRFTTKRKQSSKRKTQS